MSNFELLAGPSNPTRKRALWQIICDMDKDPIAGRVRLDGWQLRPADGYGGGIPGGKPWAPGWLVACLSQFAQRGVNLTRIESRPRKQGLGQYMFFCDLEGGAAESHVAAGLTALGEHVERLRVLGSFPVA